MISLILRNIKTKNTAWRDVVCWYLATVWINIDRERASPSKYHLQCVKFSRESQAGNPQRGSHILKYEEKQRDIRTSIPQIKCLKIFYLRDVILSKLALYIVRVTDILKRCRLMTCLKT